MNADRQRLVGAIRRIARAAPEISSTLATARVRGDQPASSGIGVSSGSDSRQCCDGSEGNANPGTEQTDTSEGEKSGGLDDDDPADLKGDNGEAAKSLSGLTDCATGQPVSVQMGGGDWVPPDGWDDPQTPPVDPEFTSGVYYEVRVKLGDGEPQNFYYAQTCSDARSYLYCDDVPDGCGWGKTGNYCGAIGLSQGISVEECAESYNPICDEPLPLAESWLADGAVNLAIKNGSIVGSKYDPENDGSYSTPRNGIELCDGDGNSILLEATETGWRSIKSLGGEPHPDTVGYEYNGRGEIVRVLGTGEWIATGADPRNF